MAGTNLLRKSRRVVFVFALFTGLTLVGCGQAAEPDTDAVAAAVNATVTVIAAEPQLPNNSAGVSSAVEVTPEALPTPTVGQTATPEDTVQPTLYDLIPPRWIYNHHYAVTEEYDRFTGNTKVSLDPERNEMVTEPQGSLSIIYSYEGETPSIPLVVGFSLWSLNDDWEYLRCHTLNLLVDGAPLAIETEHDGEIMPGANVLEAVIGEISPRTLLTIANAKEVEAKLCNTEFKLSRQQMTALKDVASRMSDKLPESPSPTIPASGYDLALVQVDGRDTDSGFEVSGSFHNQSDITVPQLIVIVTFRDSDTGGVITQEANIGPLEPDASETFSITNPDAGNWNYSIELETTEGVPQRYRDQAD